LQQAEGFTPGTPVSSTNKTDRHDTAEILLKVALSTIDQPTIFIVLIPPFKKITSGVIPSWLTQKIINYL
jgi:hypothetical protein